MPPTTTIKVSRELRDRLAARAQRDRVTLGVVIARALDESEERSFWSAVTAEHAALGKADRVAYVADGTIGDSNDPADDPVSLRNGW